jgi:hypothetical protein
METVPLPPSTLVRDLLLKLSNFLKLQIGSHPFALFAEMYSLNRFSHPSRAD